MERKPEYLEDWWAIITTFEKVMWVIAAVSALIFMFQVFLFFNKFLNAKRRSDDDLRYYNFWDSLLAFQNIIVFLTFFSWGTLAFFGESYGIYISLVYGAIVGLVVFLAFAYLFYYYDNK